ncbi:kynurenine 3-monooxygenase [Bacillus rossius redtenbacheri]|uniref:kynurenine 3-monooxygenase n=1 Tax=Bacillus rossius redtenbacheri TaxID=93214 RepID=UPI002FDD21A8
MAGRGDTCPLRITVVGGGLVGSLAACYFAKRGHTVHLYEGRDDVRASPQYRGRSINLAMSARARAALAELGLEAALREHGVPLYGRMLHRRDGSLASAPYDPRGHQCIYSVNRKYLNEVLLTEAEKQPNVHLHFNHKLVSANLELGETTFLRSGGPETVPTQADLVVGADGAHSAVRGLLVRRRGFNYSQEYIEHGYLELRIPPTAGGEFAMAGDHLHIWPRRTFMMIALPNQDRSYTVTLFMPFRQFERLGDADALLRFFADHFPDSLPLIGERQLVDDFFAAKPSPLVSVKCNPYHCGNTAVIIGDAAHAMVPFYGQGMNAGFEDCRLLNQLMARHRDNMALVLKEFSETRSGDAAAICDLAIYNYVEMRDLVNKKSFVLRKKLDRVLNALFPDLWLPLYTAVTFSHTPYSACLRHKRFQDRVLGTAAVSTAVLVALLLAALLARWCLCDPSAAAADNHIYE